MANRIVPVTELILALAGVLAAQNPEAAVLGGPCLSESQPGYLGLQEWHAAVRRHSELSGRNETNAAIEVAKEIVRSRCHTEYWWLRLAESLAVMDRLDESVAVLHAYYLRGSNAVGRELRNAKSSLRKITDTEAYKKSALAGRLAADRRAVEARRKEAAAKLPSTPAPPRYYVAKNACPGECCTFGNWTAEKDTPLYDRPGGSNRMGLAAKGAKVEALTGEVHLRPVPVRVRHAAPGFMAKEGAIVFLLDYLGEGFARVWVNGRIEEAEIIHVYESCSFGGPECWGEFVNAEDAELQGSAVWWVKVRAQSGAVGWTKEPGNFGGMDGCG
jgi:hypothetical protein